MAKYRKKPIVIEAIQYNDNEYADKPWTFRGSAPEWLREAVGAKEVTAHINGDFWELHIKTLEGVMCCDAGDWIIQGVKGELYPCKPDIFKATYESVTCDPPPPPNLPDGHQVEQ